MTLYQFRWFRPSGRRFRHSWVDHIVTPDHPTGHTYASESLTWARSLCGMVGGVYTPAVWQRLDTLFIDGAAVCGSCARIARARLRDGN